ncbi:hypothetical protein ACUH7Y_09710 [Clostridium beijerinckii]|uniref:DUF4352 domain-containing protein n=1 Tax=Clostridium beijerinckii TaxID=1520 RepID=A0A7X9SMU1_CLOBE|nr:hypothetical protein [Clostridium beijerinckii]NMF04587.1 hypothetical protein [Clostridium beijerinckii]
MMKKKLIASVLALFTIISLVGCGSTQTTASADTKETVKQEDSNPNEKTVDGIKFTLESVTREPVKGDRTKDDFAQNNGEYFAIGPKVVKASDYENIVINLKIENTTDKAIEISEYGWTAKMKDGYKLNDSLNDKDIDKQIASHNDIEGAIKILVEKKLDVKEFNLNYNLIDYTNFDKMLGEAVSGKSEAECKAKYPELFKENYVTFNIQVN